MSLQAASVGRVATGLAVKFKMTFVWKYEGFFFQHWTNTGFWNMEYYIM